MKKRVWSLLLCFMLVCAGFTGCGSKDDTAANAAPEEMVKVKLTEFADKVSEALSKAEKNTMPLEASGCDVTLDVTIEEQIATSYGLTGLSSLGLKANVDVQDSACLHAAGSILLNGQDVVAADIVTDREKIYLNVPAYSEQYMGVSYEEVLGKSLDEYTAEIADANEGMPSAKDLLDLWNSFSAKFIDSFTYQGQETKQSIGSGDYKMTGDKYTTTATAEALDASLGQLVEELKKFPKLDVQEFSSIAEDVDTFNINYYLGKNDEYAWEFEGVKDGKSASVVIVSAKKGFCFYVVDEDGKEDTLVYSVKESDKKGKITICTEDGDVVIEYDNYTKDSVDLSTTLNGMAMKFQIRSTDEDMSVDFDVNVLGFAVAGKMQSTGNNFDLAASVTMSGIKMGSLSLNVKPRDFASYSVPASSVSAEEWSAGFDQEKLIGDMSQLMMQFPFLMDLMQ